ncbi:MAG: uroporphyrinogen-III synthase [Deinococcota bacterium]
MHVLLTHSEGKLKTLEPKLRDLGFQVSYYPAITTIPLVNDDVRKQAEHLLDCDWLAFTSRSAVDAWQALELPLNIKLAAVGDKTAQALEAAGGRVNLTSPQANADDLAAQLIASVPTCKVGLPQGSRALGVLETRLQAAGFEVHVATIYCTDTRPLLSASQLSDVDAVVLASPSAVEVLPKELSEDVCLIALGPSTGKALAARGLAYLQAETASSNAIIKVLAACRVT